MRKWRLEYRKKKERASTRIKGETPSFLPSYPNLIVLFSRGDHFEMTLAIDILCEVTNVKQMWGIKVRVIRMWSVSLVDDLAKPYVIEMVLLDKEVNSNVY